jgi:flagellar biosynthesis protein FliQ
MTEIDKVIDLLREAILLTLVLASPVLLVGLATALIVGLFQSATQIQDPTISFIPKIAAMLAAAIVCGPWVLTRLVEFSRTMFGGGP